MSEGTILDFRYCFEEIECESVREWLDPVGQEGPSFVGYHDCTTVSVTI